MIELTNAEAKRIAALLVRVVPTSPAEANELEQAVRRLTPRPLTA